MSERVERKILALIGDHREIALRQPDPRAGRARGGAERGVPGRRPTSLAELARPSAPTVVVVRRIGEPVQVDHEALSLLTAAGLLPGQRVEVRRQDGRVIVVRDGAEEAAGVSLPDDVAAARLRGGGLTGRPGRQARPGADAHGRF